MSVNERREAFVVLMIMVVVNLVAVAAVVAAKWIGGY